MNIYLFELKRTWKSAASWTAVLLAVLILLMTVAYPVYYKSRDEVEAILAGFPPEFSAAFGLAVDDIFSYGGFYAFGFLYLSLLGAIMAAMLGLDIFAREKRAKCMDFLITKPICRGSLFAAKLLAALTLLAAANVFYLVASMILYRDYGQDAGLMGHAILAANALFFTQLVILAVAVCVAAFAKKLRSVSGGAMAIGFGGFILTALHSILQEDALRYITPYKYFDVSLAFAEGRFETSYVVTAAVVTLTLLAASFVKYCRGDIHAV